MDLTGKVIAITGAFGNLGAKVALAAMARGAKVALVDRASPAPPDQGEPPGALRIGNVDLSSFEAATGALSRIASHFGGLDILVNAAGTFRWQTLEDGDLANWDLLYAVNTRTAVAASKAALPHLLARGAGRIINVGANAAVKAAAGMGPYTASKSAVARLTESLAEELKDRRITVNAVLPSIIDTPQNRADMPDADFSRWVPPAAIAEVILFLASDAAWAVTGALIPVVGRVV